MTLASLVQTSTVRWLDSSNLTKGYLASFVRFADVPDFSGYAVCSMPVAT